MATIFVISTNANLYSPAYRLSLEGHDVSYFTREENLSTLYWKDVSGGPRLRCGAVEEAADFYLLDPRGSGGFGEALARDRKAFLGGSRLAVKMATDEGFEERVQASFFGEPIPPLEGSLPIFLTGLFDGSKVVSPLGLTLVQRRMMEGERGMDIGVSGLFLSLLPHKFEMREDVLSFLTKADYKGFFGVRGRVFESQVWWEGLELTLYSPLLELWMEMTKLSLYELLFGLSTSTLKSFLLRPEAASLALNLSVIPFTESPTTPLIIPVDDKHLWPDTSITLSSTLGWVTARGADLSEARRRVYRTVGKSSLHPSVQYRRDLGQAFESQLIQLQKWGWC